MLWPLHSHGHVIPMNSVSPRMACAADGANIISVHAFSRMNDFGSTGMQLQDDLLIKPAGVRVQGPDIMLRITIIEWPQYNDCCS